MADAGVTRWKEVCIVAMVGFSERDQRGDESLERMSAEREKVAVVVGAKAEE